MNLCNNIIPVRQPTPTMNKDGDCFVCAVLAVYKHMFPERDDLSFDMVLNWFKDTYYNSDKECVRNHWYSYGHAFSNSSKDDFDVEYKKYLPMPDYDRIMENSSNAFYKGISQVDYLFYLEAFLSCGWNILTLIDSAGRGSRFLENNAYVNNNTNHVIILDGVREYWPKRVDGESGRALQYEIHVVDSSRVYNTNEYWINARSLINDYGAAGMWLIRKLNYLEEEDIK
jgi:hypothetical protein